MGTTLHCMGFKQSDLFTGVYYAITLDHFSLSHRKLTFEVVNTPERQKVHI